ncbi:MAG: bifunctional phosphopantothenoylcysteine decarboxylase/phosphopantothenate--cysteine ligase CoaBC [Chloroflexi bacterium]|uniref:Coenzyme A biosynthesis bifunctional protein CoaBC n=1 Tax=Candidatus Chlorohelix allophototropha TaxID=3003348 RepID=A0A8T7LY10_9CHLR|nr:bifunctional phosphopantothenoylcysteine decarboxylase/phosphopantothenate--cysteine ligase CoaBC [Chloroflexota bacterium]WJW67737.1 bifunctional phosphopantothenoylcysteine decarboxylase/phosphopantothenate--cysteine ligase CoaBC [Chloroflexota bacterium L227-S17]
MTLKDRNILLGVSGGIAAYKVAQLARDLTKEGAKVDVVMTEAATRFVTPLTFQALTHRKVYTDLWQEWTEEEKGHVTLAHRAELAVIAPATADIIARLAQGLANDILTTSILGCTAPLIIVPAMESNMYQHPATQQNLATLRERGAFILEPGVGMLASGASGVGRMPEPEEILGYIRLALGKNSGDLIGKRLIITAGGTQEPLDPVRYLGNRSSGQMGYALAQAALERGADVTLISGPVNLKPPVGCKFVSVKTAREMEAAVQRALFEDELPADVLVMAAAVADFRPVTSSDHKIKKDKTAPTIELTLNPDILGGLKDAPGLEKLLRVGFAAETDDLHANAEKKLNNKNLDMIVANEAVSSIGHSDNQVTLIERGGIITEFERKPKRAVAELILDKVVELLAKKTA